MSDPPAFISEGRKPVLIEDWLPIRELGIEAVRESAPIPGQFPKLKTIHVWWARAPLVVANGITLAALLPVWEDMLLTEVDGLQDSLIRVREARADLRGSDKNLPWQDLYRAWVLWVAGIRGNAVLAARRRDEARERGAKLKENPFTWRPAYRARPTVEDLATLHRLLQYRWDGLPRVADPTAGGGTIPYSAMRYGLKTWANDLSPVAVSVLEAALDAPSRYGPDLTESLTHWGKVLVDRCVDRLAPYFPKSADDEQPANYIFANTVACPRTGGPVPLSPSWWLREKGGPIAVRPIAVRDEDGDPSHVEFESVEDPMQVGFDPSVGTVKGAVGVSLWDGQTIDSDYIKAEAKAGRMWPTLFAIRVRRHSPPGSRRKHIHEFRAPNDTDLQALLDAESKLKRLLPEWEKSDVLPVEAFPSGNDNRPLQYGMVRWRDMFTTRQLLVYGVFVEEWRRMIADVREAEGQMRGDQILTLLALMQGKAINYNARLSSWDVSRQKTRSVFERHDFAFKWTYAEFEGGEELWPWALDELTEAYAQISELLQPASTDEGLVPESLEHDVPGQITLSSGSAASLPHIGSGSIELVNMDPPYYQNVMYAELADFFYVWEKRTLGVLHPERFAADLTDKANEAVANEARFEHAKKRKKELAKYDYQQKMAAIFSEARRILTDDGVMVVWFTHKEADAWDALGTAMMDAGFTIEASWPVSTQSQTSLHHAKKNSAKSTVMLVCRKRPTDSDGVFFEDIEADLRAAARQAVAKFEEEVGVGGVDLLLSTYGPTLSVIARNWPVLSSESDADGLARRVKPEEALTIARQEVARIRMRRLVGHEATFDAATDFWLLAWETFKARTYPYDEARKHALGVGYDIDDAAADQLVKKRSGDVDMIQHIDRGRLLRRRIDDSRRFVSMIDAVHHMLNVYQEDGLAPARQWLSDTGYGTEAEFRDVVQAAVNAVPRTRGATDEFDLPEARALEDAIIALFDSGVTIPADVEAEEEPEQTQLDLG